MGHIPHRYQHIEAVLVPDTLPDDHAPASTAAALLRLLNGDPGHFAEKYFMNKRTLISLALLVILCAELSACATTRQVSSGTTNQCLNVEWHGYPVAGTPLRVKQCDPWRNQQWSFNKDGSITGVGGFCVDVQSSEVAEGTAVIYVPCNGSPSQKWTVNGAQLVGIGGKCVDVSGGEPQTWAPLVIASCNGSPTQQWLLH